MMEIQTESTLLRLSADHSITFYLERYTQPRKKIFPRLKKKQMSAQIKDTPGVISSISSLLMNTRQPKRKNEEQNSQ